MTKRYVPPGIPGSNRVFYWLWDHGDGACSTTFTQVEFGEGCVESVILPEY